MSNLSRPVARKLTKKDLLALFIHRRILGERYPRCAECHKRVDLSDIANLRMIHKDGTPMCRTKETA